MCVCVFDNCVPSCIPKGSGTMPDTQHFNKHLLTSEWKMYSSPKWLLKMQNSYFHKAVITQTIFLKRTFLWEFPSKLVPFLYNHTSSFVSNQYTLNE